MAQRIRDHAWENTPLGPPRDWPQSLRTVLSICLNSSFPTAIYWGPEFRLLYNDAWLPIPGPRHPDALGKPAREVWPDIWHVIEPQLRMVSQSGQGLALRDQKLPMNRFGLPEECYWDYSFTPIAGEDGGVAGIFNQGQETTERVLTQQRSDFLVVFNDRLRTLDSAGEIIAQAVRMIGEQLDAGRAGYGEIDSDAGTIRIERCWTNGMEPLPPVVRVGTFGTTFHERLEWGENFVVNDALSDPRIIGTPAAERYAGIGARAVYLVPLLKHGRYAAVLFVHDSQPRAWSPFHARLLRVAAERIWQEVARARAETALRDSEERHRLVFEQANDVIFTADLEQRITACNAAAARAMGLPAEEIVGRSIAEFIAPEDFQRTMAMLKQKLAAGGGTTQYEVDVTTRGGRVQRWEINSALAIDRDGDAIGLHAIARNVTARRAHEESQRLLINELNHRVKNTLALVQGLALQSFREGCDSDEARGLFQARLATLAAAHDLLTREQWEGATLSELVADALRPHADPPGRITAKGPAVMLNPKGAISLVLALHELGTNAAKYGALSVPEGKVKIGWTRDKGRVRLEWRETGGPSVSPPSRHGFGLRMIQRALASDLGGEVTVDFASDGLVCIIDAPDAQI